MFPGHYEPSLQTTGSPEYVPPLVVTGVPKTRGPLLEDDEQEAMIFERAGG